MDLSAFQQEAERLIRPGLILREAGAGSPAAYWHQVRSAGLCLSIAYGEQWLHVYRDDAEGGYVTHGVEPLVSDTPLYATPHRFLPPVDAIFLLGSDAVGRFLARHGWSRDEPYNPNFPDPAPGAYEEVWQDDCPIYAGDAVVVTGGWHFAWPDGDWYEFVESELVAWTLRDSEPWVEVFRNVGRFTVKQRIT